MADRVFCIDFGSAYTKVALRRDPGSRSELLALGGAEFDFWVPTVVAMDQRGKAAQFEFGDKAADLRSGGGIHVFTNFKRDLFLGAPADAPRPAEPPLEALLRSDEFAGLAARFGVTPVQVGGLRVLVESARLLGATGAARQPTEQDRLTNAERVTGWFFRWLRERVLDACKAAASVGLDYERFPTRVAVPVFDTANVDEHPGYRALRAVLERAGWPLDAERPFVFEPEANALGVLTAGANVLTPKRRDMNFGEMLKKGPLNTVLAGHSHYTNYRALVVDVGAFTTDFASLFLETNGRPFTFSATDRFRIAQRSVPYGLSDLDERVRGALPADRRERLAREPRRQFSAFQRAAYPADGRGLRIAGFGTVGGEDDRAAIQPLVAAFAERVASAVTAFCADHPPALMQELILTGGGNNIPLVRDAVIRAAEAAGGTFKRAHATGLTATGTVAPLVDDLSEDLARGASALGGTSVYFDKSYS